MPVGYGPRGNWSSAARARPKGSFACSTAPRRSARRCATCSASARRSSARIRHKERNVLDHLPERDRAGVRRRLRAAWAERDHARALDRLEQLVGELGRSHPGAAASLREGMAQTLTLTRLGITGPLTRTLASTNQIESMIECVRRTARNVKRWQSGEMALRWTAAGMLEAERQFRRIIGYQQLATLALAIERDLAPSMTNEEVATLVTA